MSTIGATWLRFNKSLTEWTEDQMLTVYYLLFQYDFFFYRYKYNVAYYFNYKKKKKGKKRKRKDVSKLNTK